MLQAHNLTCVRDERMLFSELCFTVSAGDIVQIEGANGAGKTSLLRILAGLSQPEQGEVRWQQQPIRQQRDSYHTALLYLGHLPGVKAQLTARENLQFFHASKSQDELWQALEEVDLAGFEDTAVAQLSAGQQRRVALARLWLTRSPLWILDEPLTAIDKTGVTRLAALFSRHAQKGGAVILTTHQDLPIADRPVKKISLISRERA